jgi:phage shock protein PspC (stress-responsive transcriptional regulator)
MSESTHTIENGAVKRLERSRSDRMLAGVCGGLARYFDIHTAVYRVGFVVLTLLGGAGILIYLAAALVMPDEGETDSVATAALRSRRERPWPLVGLALVGVAVASLLARATFWPQGDAWWLLLLAGAAILWITRHGMATAPPADASALALEDSRRMRRLFKRIAIAFGMIVALVLVAAAVFAAIFHVHLGRGIGDRNYVVAGTDELRRNYRLGIGDLTVDLSKVQFKVGETHVGTRVDVGELRVVVPRNVALKVHGDAQLGQVEVLSDSADGRNVDRSVDQAGRRVLVLDAHVGAGVVRVMRAVR